MPSPLPSCQVPEEARKAMDLTTRGAANEAEWNAAMAAYTAKYPAEGKEFAQLLR